MLAWLSDKKDWTFKALLDISVALIIGIVLALVADWFLGEEYASRQQAKILAPVAGYVYGTSQRDSITVLLIDDASLDKVGLTWPAPYSYQARLLRAVGRYQPKAVFLDIYFKDNRKASDISQLVREICALKAQGIEVYLGATQDTNSRFTLRHELEEKTGTCFKKVALYFTPDDIDKTAWSYPVSSYGQSDALGAAVNSAAVEIYNGLTKVPLVAKTEESKLALTWGAQQAEHGIAWTAQKDGENTSELYCRDFQGVREMIPGGFRQIGLKHHDKPLCVYHETLLVQDLSTNSATEEALVDKRIRGKTVMIGVALSESRDQVFTPLHGNIPGVYLHAMALDNLLTYGADYPEEISLHPTNNASQRKLFSFLLIAVALVALIKASTKQWRENARERVHKLVHKNFESACKQSGLRKWGRLFVVNVIYLSAKVIEKILLALLITAATGVVALLGASIFHIGFISTFSIAMFVVAAEWFEIKEKLSEHFLPHKNFEKASISSI